MANYLPTNFSPPRIRSYVYRLPLFTRIALALIVACYVATIFSPSIDQWAALKPSLMTFQTSKLR